MKIGISDRSVRRIMKNDLGLHPYKIGNGSIALRRLKDQTEKIGKLTSNKF